MKPNIRLSYSTNVHPAETLADLERSLREYVAPISRDAFGEGVAATKSADRDEAGG